MGQLGCPAKPGFRIFDRLGELGPILLAAAASPAPRAGIIFAESNSGRLLVGVWCPRDKLEKKKKNLENPNLVLDQAAPQNQPPPHRVGPAPREQRRRFGVNRTAVRIFRARA